ncbi:TPA: hypothetical protein ACVU5C_003774 [Vibrio parahaemolyticus]|nr:hypothetical protein [Vibrio parahaemolyticus]HBC3519674.1 hypothetical protein [Vibrio parahaemolyticus]HBC3831219.1 hypothetical protein [Vibrio parahaemolyticus]
MAKRPRKERRQRARKYKQKTAMQDKSFTIDGDKYRVSVKAPRPVEDEAHMSYAQRRQQKLRKLGLQMAQYEEEYDDFCVPGFTPYRVTLDNQGNVKRLLVEMPVYYQQALTTCQSLMHDPSLLPRLSTYCPSMNREDSREITSQVLAVLVCEAEFEGGRIGVLRKGAEMETVPHYKLRLAYLLRFGREIDERVWLNAYERLVKAGYIIDGKVTLPVEVPAGKKEKMTVIRSAASYKQFTPLFFEHFRVTQFSNVKALIQAGIAKMKKQGYLFKWASFAYLAGRTRERTLAHFLNQLIDDTRCYAPETPIPY